MIEEIFQVETLDKMRDEILEVLSKYIEIQSDDVEISVTKSECIEGDAPSSLKPIFLLKL